MAARRSNTGEALDYRAQLWSMADALRGSMDAAEYKHVVLGLIFLKYISDAFEERHALVLAEWGEEAAEDRDEYIAESIFWVPTEARWPVLQGQAHQPTIGTAVDDAMAAIERDNEALKDVLPKDYARTALDKTRLGQVIDMVSNIKVGGAEAKATDVLGSVYEYFLEQFALAEGRKGGEFYTPSSVVRLLVEMLQPYQGRVYDPCCGSSGMFVQSIKFIQAHATGNGNARPAPRSSGAQTAAAVSIYGQESNYTTWRMARMNLAIRGIEGQIAHGDVFHNDRHPDLRADYILANPPFNVSDWGRRATAGRPALALRRPTQGQRQLRLGPALPLSPGAPRPCRLRPGQRLHVVQPVRRRPDPQEHRRGRPRRLHRRPPRPALPLNPDPRLPLVPGARRERCRKARPDPLHRRPQPRPHDRPHPPRPLPRRHRTHRQHLPRLAAREVRSVFALSCGSNCAGAHRSSPSPRGEAGSGVFGRNR